MNKERIIVRILMHNSRILIGYNKDSVVII